MPKGYANNTSEPVENFHYTLTLHSPSSQVHNTICVKYSLRMKLRRFDIVSGNAQLVGGLVELAHPVRVDDLEEKRDIAIFELG